MGKYNLPVGYSVLQTLFKSKAFLDNPVKFIAGSMEKFSDTYSASLGINKKLIITQNPDFINYVLKENHKNYKKSELSTKKAVELFGNGLLFSNGEYWLKQRRLIQPAFHKEKLKELYDIVIKSIEESLSLFDTDREIDIYPITHQISFKILINSLFDIDFSTTEMKELNKSFIELQNFLMVDINKPLQKITYPFTGKKKTILKKVTDIRNVFRLIIKERKQTTNKKFSDLLDMLLNSTYEDTGLPMNEEQVIDELLILIFAGHETTANTLSWLLYLIANDSKTKAQIKEVCQHINVFDSLNNEYIKAIIHEGMRLYPAAWMTERSAIEDDSFQKYSYPKGTIIIPFFFGLHRNKHNWKHETSFLPQRFLDDNTLARSKKFFPFGAGPRMCIGNNFAMAEMAFFLHAFFRKFEIEATNQVPEMKPLITLRPDKVVLKLSLQNSSSL
jgi:cytochrome P450